MEAKKLESKIEHWASELGFTLSDLSAPPPQYFSELTITPHRRQLWETIVETVRDRRKVEQMRKQLFAFSLKQGKKMKGDVHCKTFPSKIQLVQEKKALENDILEKKKEIKEIVSKILNETSDIIFDVCKLSELEKQKGEYMEKALTLRLISNRKKVFVEQLDKYLPSSVNNSNYGNSLTHLFDKLTEEAEGTDSCWNFCQMESCSGCRFQRQINDLCDLSDSEVNLWNALLKRKRTSLDGFSQFLREMTSNYKESMEKEVQEVENSLKLSVKRFRQEICLKSLQTMITDSEVELLDLERGKQVKRAEELVFKSPDKNASFTAEDDPGVNELNNQLTYSGLRSYQKFLNEELSKLENDEYRKRKEGSNMEIGKKEFEETFTKIESACREISDTLKVQVEQATQIIRLEKQTKVFAEEMSDRVKDEDFIGRVAETIDQLKADSEKQIQLYLNTPPDALKTVEDSSGKKLFVCESLTDCLGTYGGEFKHIFTSLLVHPCQSVDSILKELTERKVAVENMKNFIGGKKKLLESLREALSKVRSIEYNPEMCKKQYEDCDRILSNVLLKVANLRGKFDFVKKILRNWIEQPYRLMIEDTETVCGRTLKEYEELYKKKKKKTT